MSFQPRDSHPDESSLMGRLNGPWHERALWAYTGIVLLHWLEHFSQAFEIYVLGWAPTTACGLLGLACPWLIKSESLHYGFALVMLVCLWVLRKGFVGRSYVWWMAAFWIQFWHHIEHVLLLYQAITGRYFFGGKVPTSIVQQFVPRVELHLFYNAIVTVPMVIAMFYHLFPSEGERRRMRCSCAFAEDAEPASAAAQPAGAR